ncbi:SCO1664 family protein [Nocardioides limicola]|uniref:SCO1664 family protein n=1 Tax=Nocardioides limicola TaxID=2803368 RepID=UPI00193B3915|nr:SCO1664 family protein [Nocardioides sp. DJM-14]
MSEVALVGRILPASNATFLAEHQGRRIVYKPVAGERPLWDFPLGTLAGREVAAHLVSEAMGWQLVPRTWLGDGPHGPGMLQEWCEPDPDQRPVDVVRPTQVGAGMIRVFDGYDAEEQPVCLVHEDSAALRRLAVFDVVTNNADRKGGHILGMADGRRLGVDHGICFHVEPKLRTVLWGWAGADLLAEERFALVALEGALGDTLGAALGSLLDASEVAALARRCRHLLREGHLPAPAADRPMIPWPPL